MIRKAKHHALYLLFILLTFSAIACTKKPGPVSTVTPQEAVGLLRNDFGVLVDVRERDEIGYGMAEPALWFPLSKMADNNPAWMEFVKTLPKDKQIVIYCRPGNCLEQAAERLALRGFRVATMGDFNGWQAAGLPVKKPEFPTMVPPVPPQQ